MIIVEYVPLRGENGKASFILLSGRGPIQFNYKLKMVQKNFLNLYPNEYI